MQFTEHSKYEWQKKALACVKNAGSTTDAPLAEIVDMAALSGRISRHMLNPEKYPEDDLIQVMATFLIQHDAAKNDGGPIDEEWQGKIAKHKTACREAMGEVYRKSIERPEHSPELSPNEYLEETSMVLQRRKAFAEQCLIPAGILKHYDDIMPYHALAGAAHLYGQNLAAEVLSAIERGDIKTGLAR